MAGVERCKHAHEKSPVENRASSTVVAHTDGTVFTLDGDSVVAIDPSTGVPKFSIQMEHSTSVSNAGTGSASSSDSLPTILSGLMIAGDGYAYVVYQYSTSSSQG